MLFHPIPKIVLFFYFLLAVDYCPGFCCGATVSLNTTLKNHLFDMHVGVFKCTSLFLLHTQSIGTQVVLTTFHQVKT